MHKLHFKYTKWAPPGPYTYRTQDMVCSSLSAMHNTELTFKENSVTYLKVVFSPFRPQKAINLDTKYQLFLL